MITTFLIVSRNEVPDDLEVDYRPLTPILKIEITETSALRRVSEPNATGLPGNAIGCATGPETDHTSP